MRVIPFRLCHVSGSVVLSYSDGHVLICGQAHQWTVTSKGVRVQEHAKLLHRVKVPRRDLGFLARCAKQGTPVAVQQHIVGHWWHRRRRVLVAHAHLLPTPVVPAR